MSIIIGTHSGKLLDLKNLNPDDVDIEDVAHTLSLLCRWGGHCNEFYSVAEHSVRCHDKAPKGFELETLLHDASEAYLVDIPRPIKKELTQYQDLEKNIEKVISLKFNLPFPMSPQVKLVDNRMLETERRDITPFKKKFNDSPVYKEKIIPWTSQQAKLAFLDRYFELTD